MPRIGIKNLVLVRLDYHEAEYRAGRRRTGRSIRVMHTGTEALEPPAPKTGGTYHYCRAALDEDATGKCKFRHRKLKAYRRHWRRWHAPEVTALPGREGLLIYDEMEAFRKAAAAPGSGIILPLTAEETEHMSLLDQVRSGLRFGRRKEDPDGDGNG